MCTTKYKNEDNTSENTQIIAYIIKKRSNNEVSFVEFTLTAGNSNWWPRVLNCMAPGGLGLTVYRWLRQCACSVCVCLFMCVAQLSLACLSYGHLKFDMCACMCLYVLI